MPDGQDSDLSESHAARIRVMLKSVILNSTPKALWADLSRKAQITYQESYDTNSRDARIVEGQIGFKTIQDRHFYMDRVLYDVGLSNGCNPFPSMVQINRWRYTQVDCGMFHATQKYARGPQEMPIAAKFREALAAAGMLRRQDDFWRPTLVTSEKQRLYHAVVIHAPASRNPFNKDFREIGFIKLAFPYDDFLGWAANFPLDEIVSWYSTKVIGVGEVSTGPGPSVSPPGEIGPTPTWKVQPKRRE